MFNFGILYLIVYEIKIQSLIICKVEYKNLNIHPQDAFKIKLQLFWPKSFENKIALYTFM